MASSGYVGMTPLLSTYLLKLGDWNVAIFIVIETARPDERCGMIQAVRSKTVRQFLRSFSRLHPKPSTMPDTKISLTPPEKLFRECLLDCRARMSHVPGMKDLEIRWTGGWVRDKLLGTTSHDIDVALSTMTGWQFGQALQTYIKAHAKKYEEEAEKQGFKAEIKNLHKIEANPDKSKHLETITTRMFGIDVDFVNLRKEVYDEKSRNPQMEFGTPAEDAMRRDACVNALFFNLHTQQVEDFTGRGLQDMDDKLIRTPLAPYQTFKDDPLRVLRLIRFAARLGYRIDDAAKEAMAEPSIHEALKLKISRERVGVEIGKIVTGPDPFGGLSQIYNADLYGIVFGDPDAGRDGAHEEEFPTAISNLQEIFRDCASICLALKPKEDVNLSWTLAAYVPFRKDEAAAVNAARNGIKATNAVSKVLGDAIRLRPRIHEIVKKIYKQQASRAEVGVTLRDCGKSWRFHVLYALLCDTVEGQYGETIEQYNAFVKYVQEQALESAPDVKPIINGNGIKEVLQISKAGSWLKDALDQLVEWQFAHPAGTADDAKKFILSKKDQFPSG